MPREQVQCGTADFCRVTIDKSEYPPFLSTYPDLLNGFPLETFLYYTTHSSRFRCI
jgi:hypothetical protein